MFGESVWGTASGPDVMATDNADRRRLDVRDVDGEPFGRIVSELEQLDGDGRLLLVNSFEPVPLYDVLDERGYDHETTRVDDDEWHVEIRPA